MKTVVITIDGPAASGKTSVSRAVAAHFSCDWVSTGAFYRGLALVAGLEDVNLDNEDDLASLASSDDKWGVKLGADKTEVFYLKQNVTNAIFKEEVGMKASKISQFPKVREALLKAQRDCAKNRRMLVAEGRDCGTVVFPSADLKVYLTASSESRAERRSKEEGTDIRDLLELQSKRDQSDTQRKQAPLQIPDGALVIDSSRLGMADVVSQVVESIEVNRSSASHP